MLLGSALLLGLLGSLHCVGMCGPIALAVTGNHRLFYYKLFYNLGRTTTYMILGAVFGLLGLGISLAGSQQFLSIFMGIVLLISAIFSFPQKKISIPPLQWMINKVKTWMSKYIKSESKMAPYVIGIINGFLPCGLVYVAIAGAIATGSAWQGALYMGIFGLGTIPALLAIAYSWNFLKKRMGLSFRKAVPVFIAIIGILFVLRGMDLGIPYISPKMKQNQPGMEHHHGNLGQEIQICSE